MIPLHSFSSCYLWLEWYIEPKPKAEMMKLNKVRRKRRVMTCATIHTFKSFIKLSYFSKELERLLLLLRGVSNKQNGNLRWFLPLGVDPPHPFNGTNFQTFFYPTFFLLQLNPTYMKRILHFKNITFYNWFKIDMHQQLRPLTANYLAMFKVTSTTIYT